MKYRKDFVTNSSSSSFVCEVCGNTESGYDLSYSDAEMYQCENGHKFCECHALEPTREEKEKYLHRLHVLNSNYSDLTDENLKEFSDEEIDDAFYDYSDRSWMPKEVCPICSFQNARKKDIADYLMKSMGVTEHDVLTIWKSQFGSFNGLKEYLKTN